MNRKTLFFLAAVVAAISSWASAGDLKPCACDPAEAGMSSMSNGVDYGEQFTKPPEGAGMVHPGVVIATLAGPGKVKVAVDSAKADAKAPDTVRFDFTGEGKFSDAFSTPLKVVERPGNLHGTFGPATFDVRNGDKAVKVSVVGDYTNMGPGYHILAVAMTCAAEGSCDFGGKSYKVRLLNGRRNFKLGDASKVEAGGMIAGDVLLVDTGDGTFTKDVTMSFLDQPVILGGKTYAVTVNDDASRIQAAEVDVPMGMVRIDRAQWSATFIGKKYHSTVNGNDTPVSLPADAYTITNYTEKGEGKSQLMIRQVTGTVEVAAGKTVDIKIGEPLTVALSIQQSNGTVVFNLGCTDVSGSPIATLINAEGAIPPPPKFTVSDSSGKQVYQASLTYG